MSQTARNYSSPSSESSPPEARHAALADRRALVDRFRRTRARSAEIFSMLSLEDRVLQPIALRHPVIFYEGHVPAFYVNAFLKKGLGEPGIDARLERLFARGIDPDSQEAADDRQISAWPSRKELNAFVAEADRAVEHALLTAELDRPDNPVLRDGQAVWTTIEHEAMHQETLLYILHQVPTATKRRPPSVRALAVQPPPQPSVVRIPAGVATLGGDETTAFGWDNEFPALRVSVPRFRISRYKVTNAEWTEFVEAGGYDQAQWWTPADFAWVQAEKVWHPPFWRRRGGEWFWQGQFSDMRLPPAWPVFVTQAEASAFAKWKGGRLPTEAEFHRAAFGTPEGVERHFPWGDDPPDATRGWFDFAGWDPAPVGGRPRGTSAFGVDELVGNGWEWTSTIFAGFPGFRPMASYPEYSADFFDGQHYVMKGASPVTDRGLIRRSFRNWFRPQYPYVYAACRVVHEE